MNNPAYIFLFALTGNFEIANIQAGMDDYDIYTCIKFVPRDSSNSGDKYIDIVREGGCWCSNDDFELVVNLCDIRRHYI